MACQREIEDIQVKVVKLKCLKNFMKMKVDLMNILIEIYKTLASLKEHLYRSFLPKDILDFVSRGLIHVMLLKFIHKKLVFKHLSECLMLVVMTCNKTLDVSHVIDLYAKEIASQTMAYRSRDPMFVGDF